MCGFQMDFIQPELSRPVICQHAMYSNIENIKEYDLIQAHILKLFQEVGLLANLDVFKKKNLPQNHNLFRVLQSKVIQCHQKHLMYSS